MCLSLGLFRVSFGTLWSSWIWISPSFSSRFGQFSAIISLNKLCDPFSLSPARGLLARTRWPVCGCPTTPLINLHSFSFFFFAPLIGWIHCPLFVFLFFPFIYCIPQLCDLSGSFLHFLSSPKFWLCSCIVTYLCFMKVCFWNFISFCYSQHTPLFLPCPCLSVWVSGHELDRVPLRRRSTLSFSLALLCVVSQTFVIFQVTSFLTVVSNHWVCQNLFHCLFFFFFSLFHPVCRNCSVRFWISFRGNYSMGGCRFWVSVVGAEAQSRLRRHLGSETLTQFVALHL